MPFELSKNARRLAVAMAAALCVAGGCRSQASAPPESRAASRPVLVTTSVAEPASRPVEAAPTSRASQRIRIVSYNVQYCPRGPAALAQWLAGQDADIICLAEAGYGSDAKGGEDVPHRVARAMADGRHVVSASTLGLRPEKVCGVAILSRWPLLDGRAHAVDEKARVHAVSGRVEIDRRPLHVFAVHPYSTHSLEWRHMYESTKTRLRQVNALVAAVEALDGDVIVAGDFNATPFMPEYVLLSTALTDFGLVSQDEKLSFPAHKPAIRIDYVWGRGALRATSYEVLMAGLSDHLPVACEILRDDSNTRDRPSP